MYETLFRSWLEQRLGPTQVDELLGAVLAGDAERCERLLGHLPQSLLVHDVAARRRAKRRSVADDVSDEMGSEVV